MALINLDNTRFIFKTNFAGDPTRERYRGTTRYGNIIIPDKRLAMDLRRDGFNVRETAPRDIDGPDFEPEYFIKAVAKYDGPYPPKIYMVSGDSEPVLLDRESVYEIDRVRVKKVRATLSLWKNEETGKSSFYIRTMYVEQDVDSDPFAHYYAGRRNDDDREPLPF